MIADTSSLLLSFEIDAEYGRGDKHKKRSAHRTEEWMRGLPGTAGNGIE